MDILFLLLWIFGFFIAGLIVGSFLNVVIFRLHSNSSFLKGRSKCRHCNHVLAAKDLVPLFSFLFLKAKCRYCQHKLSWQYFLVELFTGLCFVLVGFNFLADTVGARQALSIQVAFYLLITCFLIIVFVYDFKYYLILDRVIIPAILIAFIFNLILKVSLTSMLIGALIGGGLFFLQFVISNGTWIGGGDIRLGVLMGILLGWKLVLVALFISYCLGALVGLALIVRSKKGFKDQLPFGTFLAIGTFVSMLYGKIILTWYLGFLL